MTTKDILKSNNHYKWLDEHYEKFALANGIGVESSIGDIVAHGDKCYQYRDFWNEHGIPFNHGVAIYLLTYHKPFCDEVRETKSGWVDTNIWVVKNYDRFRGTL